MLRAILVLALFLGSAGCRAICRVESAPSGAPIYVDGEFRGRTPHDVVLSRDLFGEMRGGPRLIVVERDDGARAAIVVARDAGPLGFDEYPRRVRLTFADAADTPAHERIDRP